MRYQDEQCNIVSLLSNISPLGADIIELATAHKAVVSEKIRSLNLYPGQEMALLALLEMQPCSQKSLGQYLCIDHSTVTTSISRMEKVGLVIRNKSEEDRRLTIIELTPKGVEVAEKVKEIMSDIENQMTVTLSNEDLSTFNRISKQIINDLQD